MLESANTSIYCARTVILAITIATVIHSSVFNKKGRFPGP